MQGFDNDERYSHSPEKMNITTLHDLFLDNYAVAEYLWKHKDFLSISSSNNLEEATELGETMGYEDGFLHKHWQERFHPFRVEYELPTNCKPF